MIVLTAGEAEKVKGLSPRKEGAALEPVPLTDGRFMLGEQVLEDEANADVRDFLASLPREPLEKLPIYTENDQIIDFGMAPRLERSDLSLDGRTDTLAKRG